MALVILLSALTAGCGDHHMADAGDPANLPRIAVVKVQRKSLASTLEISSEFQPFQEIEVYAKVSGYIQKLYVDWGTHVKQGQLMGVLEIPELEQHLQQDDAQVHRSENDIDRARETINQAESAYKVAHLTSQRLS